MGHTQGGTPAQWAATVLRPGFRCFAQGHLIRGGSGCELANLRLSVHLLNQYATDAPKALHPCSRVSLSTNVPTVLLRSLQYVPPYKIETAVLTERFTQ